MSLADFETQISQAPQKGPLKNISLGAWFGILRYLNAIFSFNFYEPFAPIPEPLKMYELQDG